MAINAEDTDKSRIFWTILEELVRVKTEHPQNYRAFCEKLWSVLSTKDYDALPASGKKVYDIVKSVVAKKVEKEEREEEREEREKIEAKTAIERLLKEIEGLKGLAPEVELLRAKVEELAERAKAPVLTEEDWKNLLERISELQSEVRRISEARELRAGTFVPSFAVVPGAPEPRAVVRTDVITGRRYVGPTDDVIQYLLQVIQLPFPEDYYTADPVRQQIQFGWLPFHLWLRQELEAPPRLRTVAAEFRDWLRELYLNIVELMEHEGLKMEGEEVTKDEWMLNFVADYCISNYLKEMFEVPLSDIIRIHHHDEIANALSRAYYEHYSELPPGDAVVNMSDEVLARLIVRRLHSTVPRGATIEYVARKVWERFGRDIIIGSVYDVVVTPAGMRYIRKMIENILHREEEPEDKDLICSALERVVERSGR